MSNAVAEIFRWGTSRAEAVRLRALHRELAALSPVASFLIYEEPKFVDYLESALRSDEHVFFGIEDGSGFCHLKTAGDVVAVNNIYLAPARRASGLGGSLLAASLREVLPRKVRHVELDVFESNAKALAWYRRLGMRRVGGVYWTLLGRPSRDLSSDRVEIQIDSNGFKQIHVSGVHVGTKILRNAVLFDPSGFGALGGRDVDQVAVRAREVPSSAQPVDFSVRLRAPLDRVVQQLEARPT